MRLKMFILEITSNQIDMIEHRFFSWNLKSDEPKPKTKKRSINEICGTETLSQEEMKEANSSTIHQKVKQVLEGSMPVNLRVNTGAVVEVT